MLVELAFVAVGSVGAASQGFFVPSDSLAEAGFEVVLDDRDLSDLDGRDEFEVVSGSAYLRVFIESGQVSEALEFTCPADGAYFRRNWISGVKRLVFPNGCTYALGAVDRGLSFDYALPAPGPIGVPTLDELNSSAVTVAADFYSLPAPYESKYVVAYFAPESESALGCAIALTTLAIEARRKTRVRRAT